MRVRHRDNRLTPSRRLSQGLLAVPIATIATIALIDLNSPESIHLGPFLVAAPAVTASFAGPGLTAVVGALAVAAQVLIAALQGGVGTPNHEAQIAAVIVISIFLVVFRHALDRHEQQLDRVRSVAVIAQQVLLHPLPHRIGPLSIASVYIAAEEEAQIGGDLYAAVPAPGGTRLVVGDVRGSGLPAVDDAAVVVGAFRGAAYENLSLPGAVAHIANASYWNMAQLAETDPEYDESFVTALVLDVNEDDHCVRLVNCGHPPPLLLRDGRVQTLEVREPALPLGFGIVSANEYEVETFGFRPGDLLLLYTDGVIEARDRSGVFYPLADRLATWKGTGPDALVEHLRTDLLRHAGGHLGDDAVLIAITKASGPVRGAAASR
ncbi:MULTISPECIES: PP2C family protein-serine/threonine phosphatase [unclassified Streptomyces]|uniref:PP2C family protein-serine/threonine phosphatase n=1 Tax=unclassified Streptomyces TaxID=2593676 RepID=UPI002E15EF51|nr:serine/threonine-protein phosphatase [Streptomyces sp. NBC_01320]